MAKIIVLMGAPGAGKGTQARLLHERLNLPQISTGDMFRALKEAHTPLAAEVRTLMEAGQLVPDDLTIRVVQERTARDDCRGGYILDGFPRTPAQAAMLEELAVKQGKKIQAIEIEVPRELLAKRMVGRRNCPICRSMTTFATFIPTLNSTTERMTTPVPSRRGWQLMRSKLGRCLTTTRQPTCSTWWMAHGSRK